MKRIATGGKYRSRNVDALADVNMLSLVGFSFEVQIVLVELTRLEKAIHV